MKYQAYLETKNPTTGARIMIRIFPRSKKATSFPTVEAAERRLESIGRRQQFDSRGIIREYTIEAREVLTIAL